MISEFEFVSRIEKLPQTITSKTGSASYTSFRLEDGILHFERVSTGKQWKLNVKQLYQIYRSNDFIDTSVIKGVTKGRTNSPSVAVLMAIGCLNEKGIRI